MSWQNKRPNSLSVRSRPLSTVASENSAARSPHRMPDSEREEASTEEAMSKEKMAQSLGSKDPAWFRQTPDRGRNSPAYRASKETITDDPVAVARKELPGMTRHVSSGAAKDASTRESLPPEEVRPSTSPSRASSVRNSTAWSSSTRPLSMAPISEQDRSANKPSLPTSSNSKTPLPALDSQRFAPPTRDTPSTADGEPPVVGRTMSNAQSRLTSDRPASPTKGMGGFVQSAFMKRTDSVNKRWSVTQPGTSLSRQDSTASIPSRLGSIRDGATSMTASHSMPRLDQSSSAAERPQSRPGSSHSTISNFALPSDSDPKDMFAKPAMPARTHSRSKSVASISTVPEGLTSPPLSPSKRWSRSPTKASWLESALARPESPKPSMHTQPTWMAEINKVKQQRNSGEPAQDNHDAIATNLGALESPKPSMHAQPTWMAEINKAKQQRNSGESTLSQDNLDTAKAQAVPKSTTMPFDDASSPAILKKSSIKNIGISASPSRNVTPPTKAKPSSLVGRPASLEAASKPVESTHQSDRPKVSVGPDHPKPITRTDQSVHAARSKDSEPRSAPTVKSTGLSSPFMSPNPDNKDTARSASPPPSSQSPIVSPKPKEETPTNDFRSTLKSRSDLSSSPKKDEPEFKAMFGKLKKAQTEKYVAPDELKNNIIRGKRGLSVSAGPQKSERRDELKESLLKKKEEMKTKAADPDHSDHKQDPAPATAVPEALKIKKQLGRTNSSLNVAQPERQRRDITPEALSLHKTLKSKQRALSPEKSSLKGEKPETKAPPLRSPSVTEKAALEAGTIEVKNTSQEPLSNVDKPIQPDSVEAASEPTSPPRSLKSAQASYKPAPIEAATKTISPLKPLKPTQAIDKPVLSKDADEPTFPFKLRSIKVEPKQASSTIEPKPLFSKAESKPIHTKTTFEPAAEQAEPRMVEAKPDPKPEVSTIASSKLAGRFNPALAGILARGPPSRATSPRSHSPVSSTSLTRSVSNEPSVGSELTHMTKNRAKGPKRRKPNTKSMGVTPTPARQVSLAKLTKSVETQVSTGTTPLQPAPKSAAVRAVSLRLSSGQFGSQSSPLSEKDTKAEESAKVVGDRPALRSVSPTTSTPPKPILPLNLSRRPPIGEGSPASHVGDKAAPRNVSSGLSKPAKPALPVNQSRNVSSSLRQGPTEPTQPRVSSSLPAKTSERKQTLPNRQPSDLVDDDKENDDVSVKDVAATWGRSQAQTQRLPSQTRRSPIQLPTQKDEDAAMRSAGLLSTSPLRYKVTSPLGLGIDESPPSNTPPRSANGERSPSTPTPAVLPPKPPVKSSRVVSASISSKGKS